jgi:hypothetical protein
VEDPYFHHPLYSSGERHGSDTQLRDRLEPLFLQNGVSVVFTGTITSTSGEAAKGIVYFVTDRADSFAPATSTGPRASLRRATTPSWCSSRRRFSRIR